ncbi:MAG: hypothetical protein COB58_03060 [Thalassobium sp.]|nr:MAG: hypothetical protein COB43_01065 [Oceanospirillales bacterium]PHQ87749.1 MAG: hypothetical protein COB58_03060 [Thalassobium sp.]
MVGGTQGAKRAVPILSVDTITAYRDYEQKTFVESLLQKYRSLSRSYRAKRAVPISLAVVTQH